jgi:hypothetical protein
MLLIYSHFLFFKTLISIEMPLINRKKRLEISSPINFEHRVHSGYDHNTGIFIDLPPQWNSIISKNNVHKKHLCSGSINNETNDNVLFASNRPRPIIESNVQFVTNNLEIKVKTKN